MDIPLPAGLEGIDARLGGGLRARLMHANISSPLASHVELHRDRALVFFDDLPAGTHTHQLLVLATTPGDYGVPGATAEAMFEPEVRARTSSTRIRVGPAGGSEQ